MMGGTSQLLEGANEENLSVFEKALLTEVLDMVGQSKLYVRNNLEKKKLWSKNS